MQKCKWKAFIPAAREGCEVLSGPSAHLKYDETMSVAAFVFPLGT